MHSETEAAEAYAAKWLADGHAADQPTDPALTAALAGCAMPPRPALLPAIRYAIACRIVADDQAAYERAAWKYGNPAYTRSGVSPSNAAHYHRRHTPEYRARAVAGALAMLEAGPGGTIALVNAGRRTTGHAQVVDLAERTIANLGPDGTGDPYRFELASIAAVCTHEFQPRVAAWLPAGTRIMVRDRGNLAERTIARDGRWRVEYPDGPDGNAVVVDPDEAFPLVWTTGGTVPPRCRRIDTPPPGFDNYPGRVWVELASGGRTSVDPGDLVPAVVEPPTAMQVNEANDRVIADRLAEGRW